MNTDRTLMQGKLAQKKEEFAKLKLKAEPLCNSIRTLLNPALTPVEEMEIAQAAAIMDDLVAVNIDLLDVMAGIAKLEKALGN